MHPRRTATLSAIATLVFVVIFGVFRTMRSVDHGPPIRLTDAQASQHLGAYASVTGMVADVKSSAGGTVFLDFGSDYPNETMTAVIFAKNRGSFSNLSILPNRLVQVTGKIESYQGRPEIILRSPSDMQVVD